MFVRCSCGRLHWGRYGAAGLLLADPARGVLLQIRAWWVHHGRTWALPGGAIEAGETAVNAAAREALEEASIPAGAFRAVAASVVMTIIVTSRIRGVTAAAAAREVRGS